MSRPYVDFPCRLFNMMNLWSAIKSEQWLLHESDAVTDEDFTEDAAMMVSINQVLRSAPHYPEVGEA